MHSIIHEERTSEDHIVKCADEYSYDYCDELKTHFSNKILESQSTLNDIQLWDELNHFGELGAFNRSFLLDLEWLHYVWLSDELFDPDRVFDIEERLCRLPFEQAYFYKYPDEYQTISSPITSFFPRTFHLKNECLRDIALFKKWRSDHTVVVTDADHTRFFKHFEYMCYFIINVREELLFDIREKM